MHKSNSIGGGVVWGCNKPERLYNFSSLWFNVILDCIMMLWLLTWHCYFVAFHVSSHNNVMSESQTWDIDLLFMFQCEGSNSHIETYKSCMFAWVVISFHDCYSRTTPRQFYIWFIIATLTIVPGKFAENKNPTCLLWYVEICVESRVSEMYAESATT